MIPVSVRTKEFKAMFAGLPDNVRRSATNRYRNYFLHDQSHPLLRRHTLHDVTDAPQQSVAVEMHYGYRAVAFIDESGRYVWYWCGSHAAYDTRFQTGR